MRLGLRPGPFLWMFAQKFCRVPLPKSHFGPSNGHSPKTYFARISVADWLQGNWHKVAEPSTIRGAVDPNTIKFNRTLGTRARNKEIHDVQQDWPDPYGPGRISSTRTWHDGVRWRQH